jgi:hypothetical protein
LVALPGMLLDPVADPPGSPAGGVLALGPPEPAVPAPPAPPLPA